MQTRRSFFSRLGAMVAVVALAPQIAFARNLDVQPKLNLQELFDAVYRIARLRQNHPTIDIITDRAGLEALGYKLPTSDDAPPFALTGKRLGVYEQLRMAAPA